MCCFCIMDQRPLKRPALYKLIGFLSDLDPLVLLSSEVVFPYVICICLYTTMEINMNLNLNPSQKIQCNTLFRFSVLEALCTCTSSNHSVAVIF